MRRELVWSAGLSIGVHLLLLWALTRVPWSLASPGLLAPPKVISVALVGLEPSAPPPAPVVSQPQPTPQPATLPEPPAKRDPKHKAKASPKPQPVRAQPLVHESLQETESGPQRTEDDPASVSQVLAMVPESGLSDAGASLAEGRDALPKGSGGAAGADPLRRTSGFPRGSGSGAAIQEAIPRYDLNPRPPYPEIARRRGYEGTVVLEVRVKTDGKVGGVRLAETSGYELLDQAALQAVPAWQFIPAARGDQPVEMEVRVPVRFQLH